jgi:hypothetical protein
VDGLNSKPTRKDKSDPGSLVGASISTLGEAISTDRGSFEVSNEVTAVRLVKADLKGGYDPIVKEVIAEIEMKLLPQILATMPVNYQGEMSFLNQGITATVVRLFDGLEFDSKRQIFTNRVSSESYSQPLWAAANDLRTGKYDASIWLRMIEGNLEVWYRSFGHDTATSHNTKWVLSNSMYSIVPES